MTTETSGLFIKSADGSRSRLLTSQGDALRLLNNQSRYGIKPGTTIVRTVQGVEHEVFAENALVLALMRWRTKNAAGS
jgi:hypothetical protein